jgi:hypothetical protein
MKVRVLIQRAPPRAIASVREPRSKVALRNFAMDTFHWVKGSPLAPTAQVI